MLSTESLARNSPSNIHLSTFILDNLLIDQTIMFLSICQQQFFKFFNLHYIWEHFWVWVSVHGKFFLEIFFWNWYGLVAYFVAVDHEEKWVVVLTKIYMGRQDVFMFECFKPVV